MKPVTTGIAPSWINGSSRADARSVSSHPRFGLAIRSVRYYNFRCFDSHTLVSQFAEGAREQSRRETVTRARIASSARGVSSRKSAVPRQRPVTSSITALFRLPDVRGYRPRDECFNRPECCLRRLLANSAAALALPVADCMPRSIRRLVTPLMAETTATT